VGRRSTATGLNRVGWTRKWLRIETRGGEVRFAYAWHETIRGKMGGGGKGEKRKGEVWLPSVSIRKLPIENPERRGKGKGRIIPAFQKGEGKEDLGMLPKTRSSAFPKKGEKNATRLAMFAGALKKRGGKEKNS